MSRLDLVDAVVYADVFGCAAAEDDVWREAAKETLVQNGTRGLF